jgi:hypothetical protein
MTRHGFHLSILLLGALAVTAGGCRRGSTGSLAPVEGTVSKAGRPLRGIEVVFLPDTGSVGPRASGTTDEAGHYRLRTDHGDDGAVAGKYRVVLHDVEAATKQMRSRSFSQPKGEMVESLEKLLKTGAAAPRVPPRFGSFNETPLRAEVGPEPQPLNFDLP